jgi:cytochrome b
MSITGMTTKRTRSTRTKTEKVANMTTEPITLPSPAQPCRPETKPRRGLYVWDPLVRIGHWTLVTAFVVAYVTPEIWLDLHAVAGYIVAGYVGFRIAWGLVGTRHARFSDFVRPWREVKAHLASVLRLAPTRHTGHNPTGGWMIIGMLIMLTLTSVSGLAVYGAEGLGPWAGWMGAPGGWQGELFEEVHEVLSNLTVLMIAVHVTGVLVESWLGRENLVRAMITGRKSTTEESPLTGENQ